MTNGTVRRSSDQVSLHTVSFIEKRIRLTFVLISIAIGLGNLFARVQVYRESVVAAALHVSVWLTILLGLIVFLAGVPQTKVGRIVQCAVVLAVACVSALGATSGDLTSLVYFGFSVMLASMYGLLNYRPIHRLIAPMVLYGACLSFGTLRNESRTALALILNLLAAAAVAYLFVVVALARIREMRDRETELARLVAERTQWLQEEVELRRRAEESQKEIAERNKALACDREVLLRELHHRSKNDLQSISSLLSLVMGKSGRQDLAEFLRPTQDRIRSIALVHEQLDGSERFDAIELGTYVKRLARTVQVSHGEYDVIIDVEPPVEITINLEAATHLGLLLHELLLCSYKYGFDPLEAGTISIALNVTGSELCLTVSDTGRSIPTNVDASAPDQDEIEIVEGLVRRLQTTLVLEREPHTRWTATMPLDVVRPRLPATSSQEQQE